MEQGRRRLFIRVIVLAVFLSFINCFGPSKPYLTSPARTDTVNSNCNGMDRYNIVSPEDRKNSQQISGKLSTFFKLKSIQIFKHVTKGQYNQAFNTAKSNKQPLAIFILPFVIGAAIAVLIWPILICCCLCPNSCPPKCSNARYQQKLYSCDLKFPILMIVLLLGVCIAACVMGFRNSKKFNDIIKESKCGSAIIVDDFINGNVSRTEQFYFAGFKTVSSQLDKIVQSSKQLNDTFKQILSSTKIKTVKTKFPIVYQNIKSIPSLSGAKFTLSYSKPFQESVTNGDLIQSLAGEVIGDHITPNTFIGTAVTTLNKTQTDILQIQDQATQYIQNIDRLIQQLALIKLKINNLIMDMFGYQQKLQDKYSQLKDLTNTLTSGFTVLCALIVIASAFVMVSAIILGCFHNTGLVRGSMYGGCVVLFLLCLVSFAISVILAILTPTTLAGCWFINDSLNGKQRFRQNFDILIDNRDLKHYIMQCLPTSQGDLIGQTIGTDAMKVINATGNGFLQMKYLTEKGTNALSGDFTKIGQIISLFSKSQRVDIDDLESVNILHKLSDPTNYLCSGAGFKNDFWIPSINQNPSYISCKSTQKSNLSSCPSQAAFRNRVDGCRGCMDINSLFEANTSKADVKNNLLARYQNKADCQTFSEEMSNTWVNYYNVKSHALKDVSARYTAAQVNMNELVGNLNTDIIPLMRSVINKYPNIAVDIGNTDGLYGGTNCRLFGENVQNYFDNLCTSAIPTLYISYLCFGTMSFCLLLASCCVVCAGKRHLKHFIMEEKQKQLNENGAKSIGTTEHILMPQNY